jgi:hypothetical protein
MKGFNFLEFEISSLWVFRLFVIKFLNKMPLVIYGAIYDSIDKHIEITLFNKSFSISTNNGLFFFTLGTLLPVLLGGILTYTIWLIQAITMILGLVFLLFFKYEKKEKND